MTSFFDRVNPKIELTSPEGKFFSAYWAGDERNFDKNLGIFDSPKIKGAMIQDLDIGPVFFPMTIFFDGVDHDLEAERFFDALKENGRWTVNHPVKGMLKLQLSTVTEKIDPVKSAGVSVFDITFLEALDEIIKSKKVTAFDITNQIEKVNETSWLQFIENAVTTGAGYAGKFTDAVNEVTGLVKEKLSPIYRTLSTVNNAMDTIQRGIQTALSSSFENIMAIGGQIQTLIQFPAMSIQDIKTRLSVYGDMLQGLLDMDVDDSGFENINRIAVKELAIIACLVSQARIASSISKSKTVELGSNDQINLKTRAQAIATALTISQAFSDATDNLDAVQELFINNSIDTQFFSQSSSFSDTSILMAQVVSFLFSALYDLKIEKRFTLPHSKMPIAITIEEYGSLGENDSNFDLFIETNELKANDILLLPAGREVVVYV